MQHLFDKCKFFNKKVLIKFIFNTKKHSQIGELILFSPFFGKTVMRFLKKFTPYYIVSFFFQNLQS